MIICSHQICSKEKSIWFPTKDLYSSVEKHLYCTNCGVIQNITEDRPKAVGYWMNKLGSLSVELGLTQCQKRLIAKDIEMNSYFHDTFSSYGSSQKKMFIHIISSYCDTSRIDFDAVISLKQQSSPS